MKEFLKDLWTEIDVKLLYIAATSFLFVYVVIKGILYVNAPSG